MLISVERTFDQLSASFQLAKDFAVQPHRSKRSTWTVETYSPLSTIRIIARRWPTGADLAIAAIGHFLEKNPIAVPDLGNVRDELAMLLQKVSDRGMVAVVRVLFGMRDYFVETNSSLADLRNGLRKPLGGSQMIDEIFQRGIQRGEIDPGKLTKRIAALPFDLVRHEGLMTHKPIPKAVIAEILDTIFLPLVTTKKIASR